MTRAFRRAATSRGTPDRPIPSPNIWHWPEVYEWENRAQDVHGAVWAALRETVPWEGHDVLDVGCGDGFHLPLFTGAASVTGVEPYAPLVARAHSRLADRPAIRVLQAGAAALPLPDASVDLVHARTAYFFGRGCEPGHHVASIDGRLPPALNARLPPSTGRLTPVTMDEAGDARNRIGPTISSGSPMRPIGMPPIIRSTVRRRAGSATRPRSPLLRN